MRVAVVGGGVSGLAAAYRLTVCGAKPALFEASDRLGGVVQTRREAGWVMEAGPDSFLQKPGIRELCRELGIEDQLIGVRPGFGRSFITRGRRLLPIPQGLYLMAPSAVRPFLLSPVVSPLGKLRMALDLVLPARSPVCGDESLASFVRRRLGREALARVAQPMIGGIYSADPEHLSLAATQPQFLDMERRHGSVIRALAARRLQSAAGARYNLFLSFREGVQTLTDALAARLPDVRLRTPVLPLPPGESREEGNLDTESTRALAQRDRRWLVNGEAFDAICLCLPTPAAAKLIPTLPWPEVPYSSMATVNLGFRREQIWHPLTGAGMVVPAVDRRSIVACTFASQKFEGRAPHGHVLVRAFVGGMLGQPAYAQPDDALIDAALADLRELLGIDGQPTEVWLSRLPDSMPQYEVGHLDRLARFEAAVAAVPTLAVAGNGARGVGLPDCIASGFAAADKLLQAAVPAQVVA